MTPAEASIALGIAARIDNRQPSEAAALAWAEALPDITLEEAAWAIAEHRRTSTEWLQPAHIRRLVTDGRHTAAERRANDQIRRMLHAPKPDPAVYDLGAQLTRDAFHDSRQDPETAATRRRAHAVECPWCHARPGEPCSVLGAPLTKTPAHPSRIAAA